MIHLDWVSYSFAESCSADKYAEKRPGPAARAIAKQAAGRPVLGISERSVSGASALGFSFRAMSVL
jgi:hypothetical protein